MKNLNLQESKALQAAIRLIEELEDQIKNGDSPVGLADDAGEFPPASGQDMPVEPPVSDSALGASTEDNVALSLLREIRDLLAEISNEKAGKPGEDEELPELPPEGEEGEEGLGDENEEDDTEEFRPGKRPMPVSSGAE